jgi:tetratricopeptide (TPR) repeat protein
VFLAGRYNDARVQFQSAVNQSHKVGDTRREADSLVRLGTTCRHLKDYAAARSHLSTARALYESLGDACRQEKFQCDRHLARVEEDSGNLQTALIAYQKLKSTTKKEGLLTQYGWCSYYLGHLYNQMERYEDALSNLKDATNISQHIGDAEIEAFATEDSGYAAERQGYLELAMDCYQKALKIFKTQGKGKWVENETRVKRRINQLKVRMENESWKASLSGLFRRQSTLK